MNPTPNQPNNTQPDSFSAAARSAMLHFMPHPESGEFLREQFIEAITEAHKKEMDNWSIMGKKPEEVYLILRALEFERIADIKVTMNNLDAITKLIQEDLRNANQRAINKAFERFKPNENR